jgi:hypothetical protein
MFKVDNWDDAIYYLEVWYKIYVAVEQTTISYDTEHIEKHRQKDSQLALIMNEIGDMIVCVKRLSEMITHSSGTII